MILLRKVSLLVVLLLGWPDGAVFAQSYDGPKTGVVDETGSQVFGPRKPGYVQGSLGITLSTHIQSGVLAANLVVDAAPGHLTSFQVSADSTLSAAAWWLLVFDATTAPVDGAVTPAKCYAYPAGTTSANYGYSAPVTFTTGIVLSVSTTGCFTKTASTHAFLAGDFQ